LQFKNTRGAKSGVSICAGVNKSVKVLVLIAAVNKNSPETKIKKNI
jgi:hypothetical protein